MKKTLDPGSAIFLLYAVVAWLLSAFIISIAASTCLHMLKAGEDVLGYVSSSITFLASCFAGMTAIKKRKKGALACGLVSGVAIIIFAISLGFIISGQQFDLSGILSLITFTLAGSLVGSVFFRDTGKKKVKRS